MAKLKAFELPGLDLWFNSDDHLPPHFHAERRGEWEVRVRFLMAPDDMFEIKWTKKNGRPSKGDLRSLARLTEVNRAILLVESQEVNVKAPGPDR